MANNHSRDLARAGGVRAAFIAAVVWALQLNVIVFPAVRARR